MYDDPSLHVPKACWSSGADLVRQVHMEPAPHLFLLPAVHIPFVYLRFISRPGHDASKGL